MPYFFYLNNLKLPVSPKKLEVKINNKNSTITLIGGGEINVIKTPGLSEISFEFLLPRNEYSFAEYDNGFKPPSYYLAKIEKLKNANQPFRFLVTRYASKDVSKLKSIASASSSAGLLATAGFVNFDFPTMASRAGIAASGADASSYWEETDITVTLEKYKLIEDTSNGFDYMVAMELKQWRNYGTQKLVPPEKKGTKVNAKISTKATRPTTGKVKETSYTVKSGDNLPVIAKKYLGSASKSKELYNLNKTVIEAAAKKNGKKSSSSGHWIYPGTKLKLK